MMFITNGRLSTGSGQTSGTEHVTLWKLMHEEYPILLSSVTESTPFHTLNKLMRTILNFSTLNTNGQRESPFQNSNTYPILIQVDIDVVQYLFSLFVIQVIPIFYETFTIFLAEPLQMLFSGFCPDGPTPGFFKQCIVTAIHEKGSKGNVVNYRLISQGAVVCKIFENLLVSHLTHFLTPNNSIDPHQHGFVAIRSICTQLLHMT